MTAAVTIRHETVKDRSTIRAVHTTAFGQDAEADLVDALRERGFAEISLLADEAGAVVGHILLSRLEAPMRALALAPVAVGPARQRSGIGTALIPEAMAEASRSWDAVFVVGDPAYYQRFGFSTEAARGYQCLYAGDFFMVRVLRPPVPVTGKIVYPPPFSALEG